jgi:hypothetical protein
MRSWPSSAIAVILLCHLGAAAAQSGQRSVLDRVAVAVDGAESSHGSDPAMWRLDPSGPQGPMQLSAAAAVDVGSGNRFDAVENRAMGRAYLEQLYRRYRDWPEAIAAYNWGIGRVDAWLGAGRPPAKLAKGVAAYTERVLRESGLCGDRLPPAAGRLDKPRFATGWRSRGLARTDAASSRLGPLACGEFAGSNQPVDPFAKWRRDNPLLVDLLPHQFMKDLEAAIERTRQDLSAAERR